jgi:transposase
MGNPKGVKRDFTALEERRMKAAALLEKGVHQAEVARQVGASREAVRQWDNLRKKKGLSGLKKAGRAGRKPRLQAKQQDKIIAGLKRGPRSLGYNTDLWTLPRVGDLIKRISGIEFSEVHVWRILRSLGWTPQKPTSRAKERDEEPSATGNATGGHRLKKSPKRRQNNRLDRRKRGQSEALSRTHVGSQRRYASPAISFQLEDVVCHCGYDLLSVLFPIGFRND